MTRADIAIVGAGAAGLMAAIWAGRTNPNRKIILLDGAEKIGRKILIAGGGRCNVTHYVVDEQAYAGASRNAIKKVLRQFDVEQTVKFFSQIGVKLKREETGKLFPTTDQAKTVLDALLREAKRFSTILSGHRVDEIIDKGHQFEITGNFDTIQATKVVLATGGKSIPKTGSDGRGYEMAQSLGHTLTPRIFPALVPLTVPRNHWLRDLKGITLPVRLELWGPTGKLLESFENSMLCTHFGLSGPAVLDISRYYLDAAAHDPDIKLTINWLPQWEYDQLAGMFKKEREKTALQWMRGQLPERMVKTLLSQLFESAEPNPANLAINQLSKSDRQRLAKMLVRFEVPVAGDRGFDFAEVTAGGIPLKELRLSTMSSRICPNLHFCGEILNVDGRIGGFNFQWAWSSGYLAGISV